MEQGREGFPGRTGKPLRPFPLGLQTERFEGARAFVLPNPSGRNANFSYADMLAAYRALADFLARSLQPVGHRRKVIRGIETRS